MCPMHHLPNIHPWKEYKQLLSSEIGQGACSVVLTQGKGSFEAEGNAVCGRIIVQPKMRERCWPIEDIMKISSTLY